MAKKPTEAAPSAPGVLDPNASPRSSQPIIPLLNTVTILATLVFLYYSKMVFKREKITESGERERLAEIQASPTPPPNPAYMNFDPLTVNIEAIPERPSPADGTSRQIQGKLHYVTLGFSLEVRDSNQQEMVEAVRPFILDKLIATLGKKQFHELTTVQGRYILHTQIIDFTNRLISAHSTKPMKDGLVTNVYFTQFIVQ